MLHGSVTTAVSEQSAVKVTHLTSLSTVSVQ